MTRLILKLSTLFILSLLLSGCAFFTPYQPNIQQGNLLSAEMLAELRVGMTKQQVVRTLGNPILENPFNSNHWPYVYTFQRNGGEIIKKQLDLYFQNNRLVRIEGEYPPA